MWGLLRLAPITAILVNVNHCGASLSKYTGYQQWISRMRIFPLVTPVSGQALSPFIMCMVTPNQQVLGEAPVK